MKRASTYTLRIQQAIVSKVKDIGLLVKFKLTLLVVFTALAAALIVGTVSYVDLLLLAVGGFLVAGASNALNEILERDYDKLMERTKGRPLATGRMSVSEGLIWAGFMSLAGIVMLSFLNPLAALLGMISLILYAFLYTPLKRISPLSVFVGAFPGALPILIGTCAVEGRISLLALCLFGIQFFWQFPHFWSIAWVADKDYKKAGYRLLPSSNGEKNASIGLISFIYCLMLMCVTAILFWLGMALVWWILAMLVNILFAYYSIGLYRKVNDAAARKLMFASFIYLPIVLGAIYMGM